VLWYLALKLPPRALALSAVRKKKKLLLKSKFCVDQKKPAINLMTGFYF
jgi:hypothetical protein